MPERESMASDAIRISERQQTLQANIKEQASIAYTLNLQKKKVKSKRKRVEKQLSHDFDRESDTQNPLSKPFPNIIVDLKQTAKLKIDKAVFREKDMHSLVRGYLKR